MYFHFGRVAQKFLANYVTKLPINGSGSKYSTKSEMTYEIKNPYKYHRIDAKLPTSATLTREDALKYYKEMFILRRMETAIGEMYMAKLVRGFCHLYIGQEAIAIGMYSMFRKNDSIITSYRCHPFLYLSTGQCDSLLAELAGRSNGCSRGKGGSMHIYGPNFYGGNGIVGAQVPLGAGIAFKNKYLGDGGVNFALYGDGGANQGQIYEAMNMAVLLKLPCVFVCENNIYGMGTSAERSSAVTDYYTRGDFVPGIWVDGMDVVACREATKYSIEYANKTGPIVIEFETYRYYGHSVSDPGTSYRSREEVSTVRKTRDPINIFKDKIVSGNLVTEDEIKTINKDVQNMVKKAEDAAKNGPIPDPATELAGDVYALCLDEGGLIRGVLPTEMLKHNHSKK